MLYVADIIKTESVIIKSESPEISESTKTVGNDSIPAKSGNTYEATYQRFMKWCEDEKITEYTENVLLTYFSYLSTELKMKSTTMWAYYSMLKSLLNSRHGVDISNYLKVRAYLKRETKHHVPKQSATFTKEQYEKFLSEAPDEKYLAIKVVMIIGIAGGCRREELVRMKVEDIEDLGTLLFVKVPDSTTERVRTFTITGDKYINIYRKYFSLRPKDLNLHRLFLKYRDGKCHRSVIGINTFGKLSREVASYLKLPNWKEYTGHCFKKTSAALHKAQKFQL